MKTFKVLFLGFIFLFSIHMQAQDKEAYGIEEDVENLFQEIEEEEQVNNPQDEYSLRQGDYGHSIEDGRAPNGASSKYQGVRKEFLEAGESAIKKDY